MPLKKSLTEKKPLVFGVNENIGKMCEWYFALFSPLKMTTVSVKSRQKPTFDQRLNHNQAWM